MLLLWRLRRSLVLTNVEDYLGDARGRGAITDESGSPLARYS